PLVDPATTSVGRVIDQAEVGDLPLNGRNFLELAQLQPAVKDRLPADAEVLFREPTFWQRYRDLIIDVIALFTLQSALIAALLVEQRRRQKATISLMASEDRFRKVFKACPLPISLTALADGRYVDVNDRFLEWSGYRREELIGHTTIELQNWENP